MTAAEEDLRKMERLVKQYDRLAMRVRVGQAKMEKLEDKVDKLRAKIRKRRP